MTSSPAAAYPARHNTGPDGHQRSRKPPARYRQPTHLLPWVTIQSPAPAVRHSASSYHSHRHCVLMRRRPIGPSSIVTGPVRDCRAVINLSVSSSQGQWYPPLGAALGLVYRRPGAHGRTGFMLVPARAPGDPAHASHRPLVTRPELDIPADKQCIQPIRQATTQRHPFISHHQFRSPLPIRALLPAPEG